MHIAHRVKLAPQVQVRARLALQNQQATDTAATRITPTSAFQFFFLSLSLVAGIRMSNRLFRLDWERECVRVRERGGRRMHQIKVAGEGEPSLMLPMQSIGNHASTCSLQVMLPDHKLLLCSPLRAHCRAR